MELYRWILRHPANGLVRSKIGGAYEATVVDRATHELVSLQLAGTTDTLRRVIWPDFKFQYQKPKAAKKDKPDPKGLKKRRRKSLRYLKYKGQATGTHVHKQLQLFVNIMNFAEFGIQNTDQRLKIFEATIGQNGSKGKTHACTAAVLAAIRDKWQWLPLAAEFCVGDLRGKQVHATAIDLVACHLDFEKEKRLFLCELKTGYNNHSFMRGSGDMQFMPGFSNSPCHQAMVQLALSARYFLRTYELSFSAIQLFVIHATTDETNASKVYLHELDQETYERIIEGLKKAALL